MANNVHTLKVDSGELAAIRAGLQTLEQACERRANAKGVDTQIATIYKDRARQVAALHMRLTQLEIAT